MTDEELRPCASGCTATRRRPPARKPAHGHAEGRAIPFADPASRTRVLVVASGKGGVGKSSVTTNLAVALAQRGERSACSTPTCGASRSRGCSASTRPGRASTRCCCRPRPRRALHLDRVLRRGGPAGHLARPDAAQGARAVPHRRVLGRARLPPGRPAAGHRRRVDLAGAVPAPRRDVRRHDAAARRAAGRPARRRPWPRR